MWWIKIHKKLLEWEWADNPNMMALWVRLLLEANDEDKRWHGIDVNRGQFVTSLSALSKKVGISVQQVRTGLARLQETGEITNKATNKYRIITICKYDNYQLSDSANNKQNNKQITNKQQANNKQTTTTLDYKNIKKDRNIIISSNDDISRVVEFFNIKMEGKIIPKIRGCSGKRRTSVLARIKENSIDVVFEMITKASESDFLNGRNNRNWVATFDWLFLPSNFQKVLEDNYKNGDYKTSNSREQGRDDRQLDALARIMRLRAQDAAEDAV